MNAILMKLERSVVIFSFVSDDECCRNDTNDADLYILLYGLYRLFI